MPCGESLAGRPRKDLQERRPRRGELDFPEHEPGPGHQRVPRAGGSPPSPRSVAAGKLLKPLEWKRHGLLRGPSAPEACPSEVLQSPADLRVNGVAVAIGRHRVRRQVPRG
jgi:hypothetical protein